MASCFVPPLFSMSFAAPYLDRRLVHLLCDGGGLELRSSDNNFSSSPS
ncbi:hypothetical protein V2J09_001451 [Rumex salicifolius]